MSMRSWHYLMIALGAVLWIIAFFLMIEGSILGERTIGIATLLGLMGMFIIIVTTNAAMIAKAKKS